MKLLDSLEASAQAPEVQVLEQRGNRVFDCPVTDTQASAVRFATRGYLCEAVHLQRASVPAVVVVTVCLNNLRFEKRAPLLAADRRNRLHQQQPLVDVVPGGASEDYLERDARCFGEQVVLRAQASAIGRVGFGA